MMTLELQATPEEVMRAVEQLRLFGREHQVEEKALYGLALALEECSANIVHYACQDEPHERFRVIFERDDETLTIEQTKNFASASNAAPGPSPSNYETTVRRSIPQAHPLATWLGQTKTGRPAAGASTWYAITWMRSTTPAKATRTYCE